MSQGRVYNIQAVERLFEGAREMERVGELVVALNAPQEEVRGASDLDFQEFQEGPISAVFALVEVADGVARWRVDISLHEAADVSEIVIEVNARGAIIARQCVVVEDDVATTVMQVPASVDTDWCVRVYGEVDDTAWSAWFDDDDNRPR